MRPKLIALTCAFFLSIFPCKSFAGGAKTVWVDSYTRSDGTHVSGHWRSPPDSVSVPVLPYQGGSYASISKTYKYDTIIYENGKEVCGHAGSSNFYDSHKIAAENSIWDKQECLRNLFYGQGLNHDDVASRISSIFTQESCRIEVSPPSPKKIQPSQELIYYSSTMTCLLITKKPSQESTSAPRDQK